MYNSLGRAIIAKGLISRDTTCAVMLDEKDKRFGFFYTCASLALILWVHAYSHPYCLDSRHLVIHRGFR